MRCLTPFLVGLMGATLVGSCAAPPVPSRAALLVNSGQPEQAVELLRAHLKEQPRDVEARGHLIRVLGHLGQLGQAELEAGRLADQVGPEDPRPWIELGHAYELAHRYEEALALYDRAAEVAPSDARGPREGGLRAARWGEVAWAAPRLEEAARRNPRDSKVWHALGLVRVHQGRYEEAQRAYQRGLEVDPGAQAHRVGLATLAFRLNQPAKALEQYDALLAVRPADGDVQLGRAYALWRLARLSEAQSALDEAKRLGANATVVARLQAVVVNGQVVREPPTPDAELREGHGPP